MNRPRVLVVDDNPMNLKLVSDVLSCNGYEILGAADAEQAREAIRQTPPALILMDIALPGMDGLELTRLLKADESTRSIVIVALTAFAMRGDQEKVLAAGCDGYLTKPISTRSLAGQVASYLSSEKAVEPTGDKMKILVVEDNPTHLKLACHVLEAENLVNGVSDAEQAFREAKKNKPHLILLDLVLRDTNGLDLARKLKADPETRDILIVAVTSYPDRFSKTQALEAGCDAFLLKPISTRELSKQLAAEMQRKQPA